MMPVKSGADAEVLVTITFTLAFPTVEETEVPLTVSVAQATPPCQEGQARKEGCHQRLSHCRYDFSTHRILPSSQRPCPHDTAS